MAVGLQHDPFGSRLHTFNPSAEFPELETEPARSAGQHIRAAWRGAVDVRDRGAVRLLVGDREAAGLDRHLRVARLITLGTRHPDALLGWRLEECPRHELAPSWPARCAVDLRPER